MVDASSEGLQAQFFYDLLLELLVLDLVDVEGSIPVRPRNTFHPPKKLMCSEMGITQNWGHDKTPMAAGSAPILFPGASSGILHVQLLIVFCTKSEDDMVTTVPFGIKTIRDVEVQHVLLLGLQLGQILLIIFEHIGVYLICMLCWLGHAYAHY